MSSGWAGASGGGREHVPRRGSWGIRPPSPRNRGLKGAWELALPSIPARLGDADGQRKPPGLAAGTQTCTDEVAGPGLDGAGRPRDAPTCS